MKKLFGVLLVLALVLSFSLVPTTPVAAANTWYVATTGDDGTGDGSAGSPWATIQHAVNQASADDTIMVAAGTYPESITINKQLTVQSADGAENTIIDRGNINTTLVNITANGVIFSGFTVQNARSGIRVGGSGSTISDNIVADISYWSLNVGGDGHLIEDNIIRDQGSWGTERQPRGLFIYGAQTITARNNELIAAGLSFQDILDPLDKWLSHDIDDSNTVNGKPLIYWQQRSGETVPENAGTVWLIDCDNMTVENLEIKDTETAIYIAYGGGGNTIRNNTIGGGDAVLGRRDGEWNIGWRGIIIRHSEDNTVYGNTVLDARGGIEVRAADYNEIADNRVVGSREGIVVANSDETTVRGNEVSECRDGVLLWSAVVDGSVIEGNTIFDNTNGIHFAHGNSFPNSIVFRNSIFGNTNYGVRNTGAEEIDARCNWWGHASGPEHEDNDGGTGDAVSDNVLFAPWYFVEAPDIPVVSYDDVGTETGTGTAKFGASDGEIVDLQAVPALSPAPRGVSFPHGMFEFEITGLTPGATVTLAIQLPQPVPVGTVWWKHDGTRWYSLPNLRDDGDNIMVIALTDGGSGDTSGSDPGTIVDPGGPGNPMAPLTVGWEGSPVDRLKVMAPWIALFALIAGASLLVVRRRRAQT